MSPSMDEASLEEFVMAPFPVGTVSTAEKKRAGSIQEGFLIQCVYVNLVKIGIANDVCLCS